MENSKDNITSSRDELEKFIRERLKDSDKECAKALEQRGIPYQISPEIRERIIQFHVDEAMLEGLTVEKMKENIEKSEPLIEAYKKAIDEGQPLIVMKKDAATGIPLLKPNFGTFHTVNPIELLIYYDFLKAMIRLSKQKEWIDPREVIDEIENSEYVEEWTVKLFPILLYAESEHVIEIDEDSRMFRIIPGKKLSIIKRFLEHFDRPDESLNKVIDIYYENASQEEK